MRLRYLHLRDYPPIKDISLCFASGSPLQRELQRQCAIHFVVGVNGSGKSNLLRAVAEVFLALADERLPPFPVSLVYELGLRGSSGISTFVIDCLGSKAEASLWVAEGWSLRCSLVRYGPTGGTFIAWVISLVTGRHDCLAMV